MRALLLATLATFALTGCGPKAHPLESQRALLVELEQQPMPKGWTPQATLVIGQPLEDRLLDSAATAMLGEAPETISVTVPLLGPVAIKSDLNAPDVEIKTSRACDGCVRADVDWGGKVELGKGKKKNRPLPWTAETVTTLAFVTSDTADGQAVSLQPYPDGPQGVRVEMNALPPMYEGVVNAAMSHELKRQMQEGTLSKPVDVLTLPTESGIRVRELRIKARKGLTMDLAFVALHEGAVTSPVDPGEGWAAVIPAETLLGLVHANAVHQEMMKGYAAEPTSLTLTDGRFELGLKLWKAGRKPKSRDYLVRGSIELDRGKLRFTADEAVAVGGGFPGDPMGAFVNARLLDALNDGVSVATPGNQRIQLGEERLVAKMDRLVVEDGRLVVFGSME